MKQAEFFGDGLATSLPTHRAYGPVSTGWPVAGDVRWIWTSRYQNKQIAESGLVPVRITRGAPRFRLVYAIGETLMPLAPSSANFAIDEIAAFTIAYRAQLDAVGADAVLSMLQDASRRHASRGLVLLCFEDLGKPDPKTGQPQWCHRRCLADWLADRLGLDVPELDDDRSGGGHSDPQPRKEQRAMHEQPTTQAIEAARRVTGSTSTIIAASYERVSTRNQGQHGFSLGAQHQTMEEFAAVNGWSLPDDLRLRDGEDEDASGVDWDLPGLTKMLEAAKRREFQILIVPDFDRFARSIVKGLVLEEQLKQYGVRVVFQRVPVEDTPEGQLLKTQLYAFAEYDRQKIRLRTTIGKRAKAQSGRVVGAGRAAYGLRYVYETLSNGKERVCALEPDPVTGPIARDILLGLRRRSVIETMTDLNERGLTGPRGGRWSVATVYDMANNPVYAGTWLYGRRERRRRTIGDPMAVAVPVREPLITSEEWDAIQAALSDRRHRRRGRQPVERETFPLRGRMACGRCGGVLWAMTNHTTRYYACPCFRPSAAERLGKAPCDLPAVHAGDLEAELLRILYATLLDEDRLAAGLSAGVHQRAESDRLRADRLAAIDAQIAGHRKRLDGLAGDLLDAGEGEFRAAIRRRAEEIEGIIARLVRDRENLASMQGDGLSAEAAGSIAAFAAEVREGLDNATTADLMHVYDLLQIRGTVYTDPKGVRLGRKHRYLIDWQGAIQLRSNDQSTLMM